MNRSKKYVVAWLLVSVVVTGCGPQVNLVATRSRRIEDEGRLRSVLVESAYMTSGLHGEQLVYEVGIVDAQHRPVAAKRTSFRNDQGQVAASRTVIAEEVTGTPSEVSVKIPVDMIGLSERELPAYAMIRLMSLEGEAKAETEVRLPLSAPDVFWMGGPPPSGDTQLAQGNEDRAGEDFSNRGDDEVDSPPVREDEPAPADERVATRRPLADEESDARAREELRAAREREARREADRKRREAAKRDEAKRKEERRIASRERESPPPAHTEPTKVDARASEIAELRAALRDNPNDLRAQLRVRMLYLADGRESDAVSMFEGTDPETHALIEEYLAAVLPAVRKGEVDPASLSKAQLDDWLERSRDASRLQIPVATYCRSIDGFGQYDPYERAVFSESNFPRLLVYLEVANYVSRRSQTGVYRTLLSVQQKLLNSEQVELWSTLDQEIPDLSNEQRRDFYLAIGPIDFMKRLTPGRYTLVLTLRDVLGGAQTEKRLGFEVKPG